MNRKSNLTILHEYCGKVHLPLPVYHFITIEATAKSVIQYQCFVEINREYNADAIGISPRVAKLDAAKNMLEKLGVQTVGVPDDFPVNINAVGDLSTFSRKNKLPYPIYIEFINDDDQYEVECQHDGKTARGVHFLRKQAKQKAAYIMLQSHIKDNVKSLTNTLITKMEESGITSTSSHQDHITKQEYRSVTIKHEPNASSVYSSRVSSKIHREPKINSSFNQLNEVLKSLAEAVEDLTIYSERHTIPKKEFGSDEDLDNTKNVDEVKPSISENDEGLQHVLKQAPKRRKVDGVTHTILENDIDSNDEHHTPDEDENEGTPSISEKDLDSDGELENTRDEDAVTPSISEKDLNSDVELKQALKKRKIEAVTHTTLAEDLDSTEESNASDEDEDSEASSISEKDLDSDEALENARDEDAVTPSSEKDLDSNEELQHIIKHAPKRRKVDEGYFVPIALEDMI